MDWLNPDVAAPTRATSPLKVRLMTVTGSDSAAGTEVSGGSYVAQTVVFPSASGTTSTASSSVATFTNMPACTVVAIEIWDSAGTPFRWWWGPLAANKVFSGGESFTMAAGQILLSQD